nr:MAG TPA: hypothetical protein [Caudoviricetes sp.]
MEHVIIMFKQRSIQEKTGRVIAKRIRVRKR